jgi:DNA/RNA endonuclease G (NUC1)
MKKFLTILGVSSVLLLFVSFQSQDDVVTIKNQVFEVQYSQKLEQPLVLIYKSSNRPTNVNRGSMDFYTEKGIHTSDGADYLKNIYDKGHLAPAATFSDNMENLKQTFSYLNCALQDQYLNRGEWRILEEQERVWDDVEPLTVKIELIFDNKSVKLPTGATVPNGFRKHIYFEKSKKYKCYYFINSKPTIKWQEHEYNCNKH